MGRLQARRVTKTFLALALAAAPLGPLAQAQARSAPSRDDRTLEIPVGGSVSVRVPMPFERVVVGDPTTCDVVSLPGNQLLVTAKGAGETQVTVWSRGGGTLAYHVLASVPVAGLNQALRDAIPGEEDIVAHAAGGAVYLTGTVTEAASVEAATRLANTLLAGSGRKATEIVNLMNVSTSQQVQVQLKFVEVSRTSLRQMGFNAWYKGATESSGMLGPNDPRNYNDPTQNFTGPVPNSNPGPGAMPVITTPVQGAFALSFASGRWGPLSATLALLEGKGVAKTLSEPTLVASSGEKAHFIVGGEYPIPVPDPLGRVIIQFKPYGAQLTFTPTVTGQDQIHLDLDAIVSDIDKQNVTTVGSSQVPGIITRESSTSVRMRDGQSFAIAGLLSDRITANDNRVPFLGDIPLLGALFRSTNYQRNEEELVVLVSVKLVKPMDPGEVPNLMTEDEFNDPGDLQLFLLGTIDRTGERRERVATRAQTPRRVAPVAPRATGNPTGAVGFSR
jgi:pilus assembly protein CpaC